MSDSIEAAIASSIASLPGSEASSGSDTSAAVADTTTESTSDTPTDESVTAGSSATSETAPAAAATTDTPAPAATDAVAPVAETPAGDTLEGLKAELAGKRDNRIPYSRVTKIAENAEKKGEERARAKYEAELAPYRTVEFQNERAAMRVADEKPEQFLAALAQADPRYAELLAGSKVLGGAQPAATRGRAAVEVPEGDVEPDIQLTDGTLGYSAETSKKLLAQELARQRAELQAEFKQTLDERLKGLEPIEKEHRIKTLRAEAADRVATRVEKAEKSWPHFADLKEGMAKRITEATRRGEVLELHDAYIQELAEARRTDEAAIRAKIAAENNKLAAGASRIAPAAAAPVAAATASDSDPIEDAIRASIKR